MVRKTQATKQLQPQWEFWVDCTNNQHEEKDPMQKKLKRGDTIGILHENITKLLSGPFAPVASGIRPQLIFNTLNM